MGLGTSQTARKRCKYIQCVPYTFQPSILSCFDYQFAISKIIKIRVSNSDNQGVKIFFIPRMFIREYSH